MQLSLWNIKYLKKAIALKILRHEKIRESIETIVKKENIKFAKMEGIGAINNVTLGYLEDDGNYAKKIFKKTYELIALNGSVAGNKVVHMHATMANSQYKVIAAAFLMQL